MINRSDLRPALVGTLAALAVFAALRKLEAYNAVFQVSELAAQPEKFYGQQLSVTGLARGARLHDRHFAKGSDAKVVSMNLYEPSGTPSHPFGKRYVSVEVMADQLGGVLPGEAQTYTITGKFKEPSLIGSIEPSRE